MAKVDREAIARLDGMDYAKRRIKEIGMEEFEKELEWRNRNKISLTYKPDQLEKTLDPYKERLIQYMQIICTAALHDEFGFGEKRTQRFLQKLGEAAHYITTGEALLEEYIDGIKTELNLEMDFK